MVDVQRATIELQMQQEFSKNEKGVRVRLKQL